MGSGRERGKIGLNRWNKMEDDRKGSKTKENIKRWSK